MALLHLAAGRTQLRVLVIEDDAALGRLIQRCSPSCESVTVVRSGMEALDQLVNSSFDAIAADITLPDMSGLEVIARARALSPASGIVAVTSIVAESITLRSPLASLVT